MARSANGRQDLRTGSSHATSPPNAWARAPPPIPRRPARASGQSRTIPASP